ncbi:MAG: sugar ABC transporter permease [Clostridia bacterium]|nr:sugar ABC transporter permease [Clostridia bacterium]
MRKMSVFTTLKNKMLGKYSAFERKKFLFIYLLIAFPVVQMLVFWFYVNISGIMLAFQDGAGNWSLSSLQEAFAVLAGKPSFGFDVRQMLGKSVFMWVLGNLILEPIGYLTCFILTKHMIGSKFFRTCMMLPGLLGGVVFVAIMQEFYADDGVLVAFSQMLNIDLPFTVIREGFLGHESTAFNTLMAQRFVMGLGGGGLILAGAYMRVPVEVFEAAKIDGCGLFREAFQIAIPCVWPMICTMQIFDLCGLFTSDYNMYLYSAGTGARGMNSIGFYTYWIHVQVATADRTDLYAYSSAFGMALTIITLPVVFIGRWVLDKMADSVES